MSKHTKGPWVFNFNDSFDDCQITSESRVNQQMRPICVISDWYGDKDYQNAFETEQAANAKLIAAAPELLEALEAIIERWDTPLWKDVPHTGNYINAARLVVAKAKGE